MKTCSKCKIPKCLNDFGKNKSRADGHQGRCKQCFSQLNKIWSINNLEKKKQYSKEYYGLNLDKYKLLNEKRYIDNPEKHRNASKQWRLNNLEKHRGNQLKSRFWPNSSWQEALKSYQSLFNDQKGLCGCCQKPQSDFKKRFAVDHCHKTGKIRGLLCATCNKGIGLLQDNSDIVYKAFQYLLRTNEQD